MKINKKKKSIGSLKKSIRVYYYFMNFYIFLSN